MQEWGSYVEGAAGPSSAQPIATGGLRRAPTPPGNHPDDMSQDESEQSSDDEDQDSSEAERVGGSNTDNGGGGEGASNRDAITEDGPAAGQGEQPMDQGERISTSTAGPATLTHGPDTDATGLTAAEINRLWTFGLEVNHELKILVCCTCRYAIPAIQKRILAHIQKHHMIKGKTVERSHPGFGAELLRILGRYPFQDLESVLQQPPDRSPIHGIQVHKGYYCPVKPKGGTECRTAFPEHSTMMHHFSTVHKGVRTPPSQEVYHYPCNCQTITTEKKHYFRVLTVAVAPPGGHPTVYARFIQEESAKIPGKSTKSLEPLRREELPSLLRGTEWHEYVADYRNDPEDVVNLIAYPNSADRSNEGRILSRLASISEWWMQEVHRHQVNSTPNMRKYLNGFPMV